MDDKARQHILAILIIILLIISFVSPLYNFPIKPAKANPGLDTSVDAISPYNQTATPLTITATSYDEAPDNISLYYRYSEDNSTWDNESADNDTFGDESEGAGSDTFPDRFRGTAFVCPSSGTANNISAFVHCYNDGDDWAMKWKAAIYDNSTKTLITNGDTDELVVKATTEWITLNFSGTKPTLVADTTYLLCLWVNSSTGDGETAYIRSDDNAGEYSIREDADYDALSGVYPSPFTPDETLTHRYAIYCSYNITGGDENWTKFGTDLASPWSWSFNYPNGTGYYEFYSIANKSGLSNESAPANNDTLCQKLANTAPTLTGEAPANSSTGISLTPSLYVICTDADSDTMTATWRSNSSGDWVTFGTTSSISTGTNISMPNNNFSSTNTKYWWCINLTDDTTWINETYHFTTRTVYTPDAPDSFLVVAYNKTQINLTWTDHAHADSTRVEWYTEDDATWNVGDHNLLYNDSTQSTVHSDLDPNTFRAYKAWSWNGTDDVWGTASEGNATTNPNNAPTVTSPSPANNSLDQSISFTFSCMIEDDDNLFNWTLECSNDDTNSANDETNGSKSLNIAGLSYDTQYTVWANVTDQYGSVTEDWFTFTTGSEAWSNTAPTFSNPVPANDSSGQTRQLNVNVTVTDADGNATTCDFYTSTDGSSWTHQQTNTTVTANTSIQYSYTQASAYSTLYYWKVTANDTHDNSSVIYHFTTEADPGADTDYYMSNTGKDSNDGTSESTPWQNKSKLNTELNAGVINAGDDIYFNRGDNFSADVYIALRGTYGTATNPMIFGAYGTGTDPIIYTPTVVQFYFQNGGTGYWTFENLAFEAPPSCGSAYNFIAGNTGDKQNLTIHNCTFDGNNYGVNADKGRVILYNMHNYTIRDCTFTDASHYLYGAGAGGKPNSNTKMINCVINAKGGSQDNMQIHAETTDPTGNAENHYIFNVTSTNTSSNAFDIVGGWEDQYKCNNVYLKNCTGTVTSTNPPIVIGHGVSNVTVDNCYFEGALYLTRSNDTIVRNCVFKRTAGYIISQDDPQWIYGWGTQNCTIYNNDFISGGSSSFIHGNVGGTNPENLSGFTVKNNIFHSTGYSAPATFLLYSNGDTEIWNLSNTDSNYSYNMWWRGDGDMSADRWTDEDGTYNLTEWNALSEVYGELGDNASLVNPTGTDFDDDFELNSNSPAIDAGDWLTQTDGSGSDTNWVTVDEANYFFAGISTLDITGDNIFVGTDTDLVITEINYVNESFKINRSITWADNEDVSLSSYNNSAPDIGAKESATAPWSNSNPVNSNPDPENGNTSVTLTPTLRIQVNDVDMANQSVNTTWRSNSSGSWVDFDTNTTSSNTTFYQSFTNASAYNTKYWWSINTSDGNSGWDNDTYSFTTNYAPTQSGEAPTNSSTGISLTPSLYVICTDADSDTMTATWRSNSSGDWVDFATNSSINTGTNITQDNSNFSEYSTIYYWSVNCTDNTDWANATYHFTTTANNPPTISNPSPSNGASGVSVSLSSLSVTIEDIEETFNWAIETSPNVGSSNANGASDGLKTCSISGLSYDGSYTWTVNVTDGTSWTNVSYSFTVESDPTPPPANSAPTVSNPYPADEATLIVLTPICHVLVADDNLDSIDVNFYWYNDTSQWEKMQTNSSASSGDTIYWNFTNASEYNTVYYWNVTVDDGTDNITYSYSFTTYPNEPVISSYSPTTGTVDVTRNTSVSITIFDYQGDSMNITWRSNSSGSWVDFGYNISINNGTFYQRFINSTGYNTVYYWSVNITGSWTNASYSFTTELNTAPVISDPLPRDGRRWVSIYTANVSVMITDANSDFNYTIETDPDVGSISENNVSDGVKTCTISSLAYSTTYTWYVNVTDGETWVNTSYSFTTKGSTDFDLEDFKLNLPEWGMAPYKVYVGDFVWMFLFVGVIAITWGSSKHISSVLIVILLIFAAYGTQRVFVDNSEISLLFSVIAAISVAAIMLGLFLRKKHG